VGDEAVMQLARRSTGEGERRDRASAALTEDAGAPGLLEQSEALDEGARLAGAGVGEDEERPARVAGGGLLLIGVEHRTSMNGAWNRVWPWGDGREGIELVTSRP